MKSVFDAVNKKVQESNLKAASKRIPNSFTVAEYAKASGLKQSRARAILYELETQGDLRRVEVPVLRNNQGVIKILGFVLIEKKKKQRER